MRRYLVGLPLGLPLANAWLDTGHMLVAHIAKMQLTASEIEAVDKILAPWSTDFPAMSDFVSSAVWADHIKCVTTASPLCHGLPATGLNEHLDSIERTGHPAVFPSAVLVSQCQVQRLALCRSRLQPRRSAPEIAECCSQSGSIAHGLRITWPSMRALTRLFRIRPPCGPSPRPCVTRQLGPPLAQWQPFSGDSCLLQLLQMFQEPSTPRSLPLLSTS